MEVSHKSYRVTRQNEAAFSIPVYIIVLRGVTHKDPYLYYFRLQQTTLRLVLNVDQYQLYTHTHTT